MRWWGRGLAAHPRIPRLRNWSRQHFISTALLVLLCLGNWPILLTSFCIRIVVCNMSLSEVAFWYAEIENSENHSSETDHNEYSHKATRTLFVGNLDKTTTKDMLRDLFSKYGYIIVSNTKFYLTLLQFEIQYFDMQVPVKAVCPKQVCTTRGPVPAPKRVVFSPLSRFKSTRNVS